MYFLDSDHLTILWCDQGKSYEALRSRFAEHSDEQFAVSIVTVEEQLRCWLAYLSHWSLVAAPWVSDQALGFFTKHQALSTRQRAIQPGTYISRGLSV